MMMKAIALLVVAVLTSGPSAIRAVGDEAVPNHSVQVSPPTPDPKHHQALAQLRLDRERPPSKEVARFHGLGRRPRHTWRRPFRRMSPAKWSGQ